MHSSQTAPEAYESDAKALPVLGNPKAHSDALTATQSVWRGTCTKCGITKEIDGFYGDPQSKKFRQRCKECCKQYQKDYRKSGRMNLNKEKAKERQRRYQEKNLERLREMKRRTSKKARDLGYERDRIRRIKSGELDQPNRVPSSAWSHFLRKQCTEREWTHGELAEFLGVKKGTVQNWIYQRKLPPLKVDAEQMLRKIHNQPRQLNSIELSKLGNVTMVHLPGGIVAKRYDL